MLEMLREAIAKLIEYIILLFSLSFLLKEARFEQLMTSHKVYSMGFLSAL